MPRFIVDSSPAASVRAAVSAAQRLLDTTAVEGKAGDVNIKKLLAELDKEIGSTEWRKVATKAQPGTEAPMAKD